MQDLSKRARGRWGEARAAAHLRSLGFGIVDHDWRPSEPALRGDLDLVARRDDLVVFCEVKARRSDRFGGAAAAVGHAKQQQVRRLGESWLRQHDLAGLDVRFDVIAIDGVRLTHYPAAF
jgi:putative endonuclease